MVATYPTLVSDRRPICRICDTIMHIRVSKQERYQHRPYWRCAVPTGYGGVCCGYKWVDSEASVLSRWGWRPNFPEHIPSPTDNPSCLDCGGRMKRFISYSSNNPERPYWICTAENGEQYCSGFNWADQLFPEQLTVPPRIVVDERVEFKSHWSNEDEIEDFWMDMLIADWENPSYDSFELFPEEHANLDPDHFI